MQARPARTTARRDAAPDDRRRRTWFSSAAYGSNRDVAPGPRLPLARRRFAGPRLAIHTGPRRMRARPARTKVVGDTGRPGVRGCRFRSATTYDEGMVARVRQLAPDGVD